MLHQNNFPNGGGAISISEIANGYLVSMPSYIKKTKKIELPPNLMEQLIVSASKGVNGQDDPLLAKLQGKEEEGVNLSSEQQEEMLRQMGGFGSSQKHEYGFGISKIPNIFYYKTLQEVFAFIEEKIDEQKLHPASEDDNHFAVGY